MEENLKEKYSKIFKNDVPKFEKVQKSFMSILKAHSETNLTNLLKYFFEGEDQKLLREVFVNAFLELLEGKGYEFIDELIEGNYNNLLVYKEYPTKTNKKIDILLKFEYKIAIERCAIIVENKLYHELDNDLEDYFYSVCEEKSILPKNVLVVLLTLKDETLSVPSQINVCQITHKDFKNQVVKGINSRLNLINDRSVRTITDEYIRHIDDLYLDSSNIENELRIEFYNDLRNEINEFVDFNKNIDSNAFQKLNDINKLFYFENKAQIERLVFLHENIYKLANESFHHFLEISGRKVRGGSSDYYFRAQGSAYEAIRYNLSYNDYFTKSEDSIKLSTYLNVEYLNKIKLDLTNKDLLNKITNLGYDTSNFDSKDRWILIKKENLQSDETLMNTIFKENITEKGGAIEKIIGDLINNEIINIFYKEANSILKKLDYEIRKNTEKNNLFYFKSISNDRYIQYALKVISENYFEITMHINNTDWSGAYDFIKTVENTENYLILNNLHAFNIPEIRDSSITDYLINYDALLKKSYPLRSIEDLEIQLTIEINNWAKTEASLIKKLTRD